MKSSYEQYRVWSTPISSNKPNARKFTINVYVSKEQVNPRKSGTPSILLRTPNKNTNQILEVQLSTSKADNSLAIVGADYEWTLGPQTHQSALQEMAINLLTAWVDTSGRKVVDHLRQTIAREGRDFLLTLPTASLESMIRNNLTLTARK